jgi:hypothetical protein
VVGSDVGSVSQSLRDATDYTTKLHTTPYTFVYHGPIVIRDCTESNYSGIGSDNEEASLRPRKCNKG